MLMDCDWMRSAGRKLRGARLGVFDWKELRVFRRFGRSTAVAFDRRIVSLSKPESKRDAETLNAFRLSTSFCFCGSCVRQVSKKEIR